MLELQLVQLVVLVLQAQLTAVQLLVQEQQENQRPYCRLIYL
jgi:hypothetical protein